VHVIATTPAELADAEALVFEYMAATQAECGRPIPATPQDLPGVLRAEHDDLLAAFREPGALLLAYRDGVPLGCVGLKPVDGAAAEVKRLFVRAPHRRAGVARALMAEAASRARACGLAELVLEVMLSRVHVVDFYRRLGFEEVSVGAEMITLRCGLRMR
jgi:ribosomal protein S18 acetylase RimI-like enzyme